MLESMWEQADYLMHFGGGGNWLVCEKSGLVTMGIVYPEFKDADVWLKMGWDTLARELETQVYPDGAQIELTPHYHSATLSSFQRAYDIAELNQAPIPPAYRDRMELMYEYLMYVVKPDGFIPMLNDSDHGNMRGWMQDGAKLILDGRAFKILGNYPENCFLGTSIFENVTPDMAIAKEEIFGPVMSVLRVRDLDEAIEMINRGSYGNSTAIFTSSGKASRKFQYEVQCGNVGINVGIPAPMAFFPFSGMKDSFFGDLHGQGRDAVDFFTEKKIVIARWF
jgi:hypothetical protein